MKQSCFAKDFFQPTVFESKTNNTEKVFSDWWHRLELINLPVYNSYIFTITMEILQDMLPWLFLDSRVYQLYVIMESQGSGKVSSQKTQRSNVSSSSFLRTNLVVIS